jgi:transcription-repair coupling factor (superfamily II helicase)
MDIQNFSALFNTPARREAFLKLIKDNKTKHIFIQGLEGSSIALIF